MSSRLPAGLLADFDLDWRHPDGTYTCQGYRRRPHGRFPPAEIQRDHRQPEWRRPDLAFERTNLQPLCAPPAGGGCHRAKTAAEAGERAAWRRRTARRGRRWWPVWVKLGLIGWLAVWLAATVAELVGYPDAGAAWREQAGASASAYAVVLLAAYAWRWAWRAPGRGVAPPSPPEHGREEWRILDAAEAVVGDKGSVRLVVTARDED